MNEERAWTRRIALLFVLAILAGLGLLIVYALDGPVPMQGLLLGILLGDIGLGLVFWALHLIPEEVVTEGRGAHGSDAIEVRAMDRERDEEAEAIPRRALLVRLLMGTAAALGLAAIFPIRSLGPGPGRALFRTSWTPDALLVDETGKPVRADTLAEGGVLTVFPEGAPGAEDSQVVLVKVDPGALRLPPGRSGWAPQGNVCYSKICTHAGCPVGLYSRKNLQLQCPCHQSAFDVTNGAEPVFGPAPRPLPQLSIYIDRSGFLRARGDFTEPVGPGFWNLGKRPPP